MLTYEICVDLVFSSVMDDKGVDGEDAEDVVDLLGLKVLGQSAVDSDEVDNLVPLLDGGLVQVVVVIHQDRDEMVRSWVVLLKEEDPEWKASFLDVWLITYTWTMS